MLIGVSEVAGSCCTWDGACVALHVFHSFLVGRPFSIQATHQLSGETLVEKQWSQYHQALHGYLSFLCSYSKFQSAFRYVQIQASAPGKPSTHVQRGHGNICPSLANQRLIASQAVA